MNNLHIDIKVAVFVSLMYMAKLFVKLSVESSTRNDLKSHEYEIPVRSDNANVMIPLLLSPCTINIIDHPPSHLAVMLDRRN